MSNSKVNFIKFILILVVYTFFSYFGYRQFLHPEVGIDDANIFFIYSKNLATGNGFVYNIGGEKVEGFSSILWVLIGALFFFLTINPERFLLLFNIIIVSSSLTFFLVLLERLTFTEPIPFKEKKISFTFWGLVFLSWVFSSPAFITWTSFTLMETGLWTSIILLTTFAAIQFSTHTQYSRKLTIRILVLICLMMLTRPEGIFWSGFFIFAIFIMFVLKEKNISNSFLKILPLLLGFILSLSMLTLFRIKYFGFPLPNTYYAKISPDKMYNLKTGFQYFLGFLTSNGFIQIHILASIFILIFSIIHQIKKTTSIFHLSDELWISVTIISLVNISGFVVPVVVGGDHFGSYRFFQPIWPLLIIPTILTFSLVIKTLNPINHSVFSRTTTYFLIIPIFLLFSWSNQFKWNDMNSLGIQNEFIFAHSSRQVGTYMNQLFRGNKLPSVGVILAGGIKNTYLGTVIDLMGLNNIEMAHSMGERKGSKNHAAFNKDIFYKEKPEILHPMIVKNLENISPNYEFANTALKGLLGDESFREKYKLAAIKKFVEPEDSYLLAFFENNYLNILQYKKDFEIETYSQIHVRIY